MDEIKFHESVADRFRSVAVHIDGDPVPSNGHWPEVEGVAVVGYVQRGKWSRRMIVWYEGRYLSAPYSENLGWSATSIEEDEVFVVFTPTKPRKVTRYIWE